VWRRGLPQLERLAAGGGATVAAQALSILAQDALLRGRADEAATFYERALERAPEDAGLAASLSDALLAKAAPAPVGTAAGTATAVATRALDEDAPRILRARDALLARGPRDSGALAQAALMSRAAGREEDARTLLQRAQALAFFDASVGAGTYDSLVELLKGDAQVLAPTP
jgi:tetratricopeptide (TPR) repeat protein